MNPAIVVTTFNRHQSLARLLYSIADADIPSGTDLIISIDKSENAQVTEIAEAFSWRHGRKHVRRHARHLGLREHILRCGDIALEYGSVVILEDDLYVCPYFYSFAVSALEHYRHDPNVAGISLYSQSFHETSKMRFTALDDGWDVYFLQLPSSWGQCWTDEQWSGFRRWYAEHHASDLSDFYGLPTNVRKWPETSWKKYYAGYMVESDKYFVCPRTSLSTNFHEAGVHHRTKQTHLQVPLLAGPRSLRFPKLEEALAAYDAYMELRPESIRALSRTLDSIDFEMDLYGKKPLSEIKSRFVLTSKKCSSALATFGRELKPIEFNIIRDIPGTDFSLSSTENCLADAREWNSGDAKFFYDLPPSVSKYLRNRHALPFFRSLKWKKKAA